MPCNESASSTDPGTDPMQPAAPLDTTLVVNLVLCGLGAGILSLPWTLAGAGILNGLCWTLLVLGICYFTIMLLVKAGEKEQCFSLEELLERAAPGDSNAKRLWGRSCTAAIWVTYFFSLVGYLIIIADSLIPTLDSLGALDVLSFGENKARIMVLLLSAACICPLCFLNQQQLAFTSFLGTFSNCFLVFALLLNYEVLESERSHAAPLGTEAGVASAGTGSAPDVCVLSTPFTPGNLAFVSSLLMAIVIQPCILPMYEEMNTDRSQCSRKPQRSPRNFARALGVAFAFLYVLFCMFAVAGYLSFGASANGDVLKNLPSDRWYTVVSRLSMSGVCLGVYPLMLYPMVAPLAESRRTMGVMGINLAALVTSFNVSNLGVINVLNGAVSVFFFVGLFPAVIALQVLNGMAAAPGDGTGPADSARSGTLQILTEALISRDSALASPTRKPSLSTYSFWYSPMPMVCLVLLSFVVMVLGLSNTTNDAQNLGRHCLWRD
mmetsp:Transcript_58954/g.172578  ORF Transcript_58954/g.172578 Transcript_58954/m.172578 type:complete len:494 (+) Transcript_58954:62-1543(+)